MNKTNRIFNLITVWVVVASIIGISFTYFTEYLKDINWFGDYGNEWGARHYWYNISSVMLFLISLIRRIAKVIEISEE